MPTPTGPAACTCAWWRRSSRRESGDSMLARLQRWRARYATPHVRPTAVKLFQDGVIESRTAAMLAPYLDRHGDAGAPVRTQAELDPLVTALDRDGFQIHVHAIGDRAIRMTLDALARARTVNGARDSRHAIAHLRADRFRRRAPLPRASAWSPTSSRSGPTAMSTSRK